MSSIRPSLCAHTSSSWRLLWHKSNQALPLLLQLLQHHYHRQGCQVQQLQLQLQLMTNMTRHLLEYLPTHQTLLQNFKHW